MATAGSSAIEPIPRRLGPTLISVADWLFFLLGAAAAGWLAVLTVRQMIFGDVGDWWLVLVLWLLLAYLLLPRIHTALAIVYVPDYFIGRTRTYEGLLGDPVNVALNGTDEQVHEGMLRAGWHLADELGFRSGLRIVTSTLRRRSYPNAPVSPLFLFGRMQEFTYQQEVEGNPARRHHVRFWRTPEGWYLPGGATADWLAAGTYDRGVGLSFFTLAFTHRIEQNIDEERDYIVRTLREGTPGVEVDVIRHFSSGFHSRNGGGDAIVTDGDLPIVDLTRLAADEHPLPSDVAAPPARAAEIVRRLQDSAASNRLKRPMTLYIAYGLIVLRALTAGAAAIAGLLGGMSPISLGDAVPFADDTTLGLAGVLAFAVVYLLVAQVAFWGSPAARFLALCLSVLAITVGLASEPADAEVLASRLHIANLALDIGILITLSAGDVRDFSMRAVWHRGDLRRERRAAKAPPHS
ncbi:LssY C-terminal domain-containing protein [Lysobacter korlensis]|uniref:LssY C-terminal domain-containing protein n=1 Tax=Lysobacter korlensis TaxID=553636 RepID=A0ABV6RVG1_9GAMM